MKTTRLEAFSDGVLAIPAAFFQPWIAWSLYIGVALVWLISDSRIERAVTR